MKLKKNFLLALLLLTVVGCQQSEKNTNTKAHILHQSEHQQKVNNAQWEGTYFGMLPCASCTGINTLITLNANGTYEKTIEYLESNDTPETTKGDFSWDKAGRISIGENNYLIENNQLFHLDSNNKKYEGELADFYVLTKTTLEPPLDANDGYTLQQFTGSDKKDYNIIFNTNPKTPTALVETKGFSKMLSQSQAWAKGAEYTGSNTKLIVQGNVATLIIEGHKIEMKPRD